MTVTEQFAPGRYRLEFDMWIQAGKRRGPRRTCGTAERPRKRYESRAEARDSADEQEVWARQHTAVGQRPWFRLVAYPCAYGDHWHIGLPLTPEEEAKYLVESLGIQVDW